MTLLGVGGVATGADAYAKIRAGASAVQVARRRAPPPRHPHRHPRGLRSPLGPPTRRSEPDQPAAEQLDSAFEHDGPALLPAVTEDLASLLRPDGCDSVADAVGAEVRDAAAAAAAAAAEAASASKGWWRRY